MKNSSCANLEDRRWVPWEDTSGRPFGDSLTGASAAWGLCTGVVRPDLCNGGPPDAARGLVLPADVTLLRPPGNHFTMLTFSIVDMENTSGPAGGGSDRHPDSRSHPCASQKFKVWRKKKRKRVCFIWCQIFLKTISRDNRKLRES